MWWTKTVGQGCHYSVSCKLVALNDMLDVAKTFDSIEYYIWSQSLNQRVSIASVLQDTKPTIVRYIADFFILGEVDA